MNTDTTPKTCATSFGTAFALLTEGYYLPTDKEGARTRYLYKSEASAQRAVVTWLLAREGNRFRAATIRGAFNADQIPQDLNEAILAACKALGAAKSGGAADALERTLTATSGTATRAALKAWKAGGDAGLAEHDRRAAALRPLALDWERKVTALKGDRPF